MFETPSPFPSNHKKKTSVQLPQSIAPMKVYGPIVAVVSDDSLLYGFCVCGFSGFESEFIINPVNF